MGTPLTNEAREIREESGKGRGRPRCEDTRRRILKAAAQVLEEHGLSGATTDEVAERAGASKATLYRWWPTKAALMVEALRDAVGAEKPFPYTGEFDHDLRKQLRNFAALINGPRGRVLRAFVAGAQTDPEVHEAFLSGWVQPRRGEAKAVLERYRQAGVLSESADFDILLDALYGPFYFRLLLGHGRISCSFADAVADTVLRGVKNHTPRGPVSADLSSN